MNVVTGGTGFLGAHLLYQLVKKGKLVKAIRRKNSSLEWVKKIFSFYSDPKEELFHKISWVDGDILDYYSLEDVFDGATYVYHTAATVSFHPSEKANLLKTNVSGTANVVNAALQKKVKKLCYVSTIGALGRADTKKEVTEETHFNPASKTSFYSQTKYEAEKEVWRGMAEGLDAIIVNPSIIVGPGNWNTGSPQMFQTMWKGLKFYTLGTNGFIDVSDVAKAMQVLTESEHSNERFILSAENIAYKQFFDWMADAMKIDAPKIEAGPFLSQFGAIALNLVGKMTGKKHTITRETARTANQLYSYNSNKYLSATGEQFMPIRESVEKTAAFFLSDNQT